MWRISYLLDFNLSISINTRINECWRIVRILYILWSLLIYIFLILLYDIYIYIFPVDRTRHRYYAYWCKHPIGGAECQIRIKMWHRLSFCCASSVFTCNNKLVTVIKVVVGLIQKRDLSGKVEVKRGKIIQWNYKIWHCLFYLFVAG